MIFKMILHKGGFFAAFEKNNTYLTQYTCIKTAGYVSFQHQSEMKKEYYIIITELFYL